MRLPWKLVVSCLLGVTPLSLQADEPLPGFDDYIESARKEWNVPGLSVGIVKDGKVVLVRGYGIRRVGTKDRVDGDTVFALASITKNFTAVLLGQLVEEGKIDWDDPVTKHLPKLRFSDEYRTEHLTIRDLLCHRTGLERGDLLPRRDNLSLDEIVDRVRFLQPSSGFRAKWDYNNLMYCLAGKVASQITGTSWESAVTKRLFEPLEMRSSATSPSRVRGINRAATHELLAGKVVARELKDWQAGVSPAGSLHSSASDMAKWMLAALAKDGNGNLLKQKTRRRMQSIQMSIPVTWERKNNPYAARFYGAGLGWTVLDYRGRLLTYHSGSSGTMMALFPEEKLGVVVLTNLEWTNLSGMLMYDVIDFYLLGAKKAWDTKKWALWKKADPHPDLGRQRDLKMARANRNPARKRVCSIITWEPSALVSSSALISRQPRQPSEGRPW